MFCWTDKVTYSIVKPIFANCHSLFVIVASPLRCASLWSKYSVDANLCCSRKIVVKRAGTRLPKSTWFTPVPIYVTFFFLKDIFFKLPFWTCTVGDPTTSTRNPALWNVTLTRKKGFPDAYLTAVQWLALFLSYYPSYPEPKDCWYASLHSSLNSESHSVVTRPL